MRGYNAVMGIQVNGVVLPDPSEWNYTVGDLDSSGSRDANGLLHRARVATKVNYEFKWNALEWEMLQVILGACNAEKFTLVAPDPRSFQDSYRGDYYVGDRTGKCWYFTDPDKHSDIAQFDLKLKFIEY